MRELSAQEVDYVAGGAPIDIVDGGWTTIYVINGDEYGSISIDSNGQENATVTHTGGAGILASYGYTQNSTTFLIEAGVGLVVLGAIGMAAAPAVGTLALAGAGLTALGSTAIGLGGVIATLGLTQALTPPPPGQPRAGLN